MRFQTFLNDRFFEKWDGFFAYLETPRARAYLVPLRRFAVQVFVMLAFAIMADVAYGLRPGITDDDVLIDTLLDAQWGLIALLIAVLLYGWQKLMPYTPIVSKLKNANWLLAAIGVGLMMASVESTAHFREVEDLLDPSHDLQFQLLAGGIFFMVWGFGGGGFPVFAWGFLKRISPEHWREIIFVIAITIVGAVVRFWQIGTGVHFYIDELNFATVTSYFWGPANTNIFEPIVRGFPAIYPYLQNEFTDIFGRNLTGLRFVSGIFGLLMVPAIYLLGRAFFDRPTAIAAALIMATFPPHVQYSRLALNNIADPLFGTVAIAFLANGMRYNRRFDYAMGGAMLGLTQYFYEGGRLVYPPLVFIWCAAGVLLGYSRSRLQGLVMAAIISGIVAAPIYSTLYVMDAQLTPRASTMGVQENENVWELFNFVNNTDEFYPKFYLALKVYVNQPEFGPLYYGGEHGHVLIFMVPFLLIGFAYVLINFTRPSIIIVPWILLTSFGTSLIDAPQTTARYVVVFPALVLLVAVGARVTLKLLLSVQLPARFESASVRSLIVLATAAAILQGLFFFGPQLDTFNEQLREYYPYDGQDAVFRGTEYPPGTKINIMANAGDLGLFRGIMGFMVPFSGDNLNLYREPDAVTYEDIHRLPNSQQHVFYLRPDDSRMVQLIRWHFVVSEPQYTPYNVPEAYQLTEFPTTHRLHGPAAPIPIVFKERTITTPLTPLIAGNWAQSHR